MQIRTMKLDDLAPASYNPRKDLQPDDPAFRKIQRSLQEFDMVEPVIYNKRTGHLVGGHQRVKVLKEMGRTTVEASIIDVPLRKEKKLNILLNRARGRWDNEKLAELMRELDEAGAVELTGYDEWELQGLLESYDQLDDILGDYEPTSGDDEEEPIDPTFEMTFVMPLQDADEVRNYIDATPQAREILSASIISAIKEDDYAD